MTKDMNGKEIKEGMTVRKHAIIKDKNSDFKEGIVSFVGPMYGGGEDMVWAGSGGAHHPKACEVQENK